MTMPTPPTTGLQNLVDMMDTLDFLRRHIMKEGVDYGKIPGTNKNTLLKPGAEKILKAIDYSFEFIVHREENWIDRIFSYTVDCRVSDKLGSFITNAQANCNSRETKYGWRWVTADKLPPGVTKEMCESRGGSTFEFDFAIKKKDTTGSYGKPAEYWAAFEEAIANGTAVRKTRTTKTGEQQGYEIDVTQYRVPASGIEDQINTMIKMAEKRSMVAAALRIGCVSDYFTQDMEEIMGVEEVQVPVVSDLDIIKRNLVTSLVEETGLGTGEIGQAIKAMNLPMTTPMLVFQNIAKIRARFNLPDINP